MILMTSFMSCSKTDDDKLPCEVGDLAYVTIQNKSSEYEGVRIYQDYPDNIGGYKKTPENTVIYPNKSVTFEFQHDGTIFFQIDNYTFPGLNLEQCEEYTYTIYDIK